MPYYDYRCKNCHKCFSIFLSYEEYGVKPVRCTFCKSNEVVRMINRVRFTRSLDSRLDSMSYDEDLEGLENDPKALGRVMREMSRETGENLGAEFDEVVNRLEKGEDPDQIASSIPDLSSDED